MMTKATTITLFMCLPLGMLAQNENQEFRATWVVTWELISPGASVAENQARARTILDNHTQAHMNAVLWQARQNGTAYYNSSFEPWGYYADYTDPGYDPLAYAVEQAHARGLELHVWMNTFESRGTHPDSPAMKHPNWVCHDGYDNPMPANYAISPGLDSVRSYLIEVAMEIVRNYDIDGLHLDYVRWNEYTTQSVTAIAPLAKGGAREEELFDGLITPAQLAALKVAAPQDRYLYDVDHPYSEIPPDSIGGGPFPSWEDWWRWCVTEFVQALHDSIQAVKPWVRFSVAALGNYNWGGWQGYGTVYQDAALWFNEGYVEQLTPMHYHWTDGGGFLGMLRNNPSANWEDHIQPGINAGRLYSVGPASYILSRENIWSRHEEIVAACRTVPWVDGFQFFSSGYWDDHNYWGKAGATFFESKIKVRPTKLIVSETPPTPSLALLEIDSLTYQLTVTPAGDLDGARRFAIYRSEEAHIDTATNKIVDIHFGREAYTVVEHFTGTQDFNGAYSYGATMLDRYWNESMLSNTVTTEPVPSFPPVIIATTPEEGDTIPVTSSVSLTFSKTIDTTTFAPAISLDPIVTIDRVLWSPDWASNATTATILFAEHLQYDTTYTLTVAASLLDINGKPLDGNGDGIGGDPDTLRFVTEPRDITGPVILASYPDISAPGDSLLFDEVVTFLFDEHLDLNSITDTTLALTQDAVPIASHHKITNVRARSVLSLQPLENFFARGANYALLLRRELTDSVGNPLASDISLTFVTSYLGNVNEVTIDKFFSSSNWERPGYSGSTVGIVDPNTTFSMSTDAYLPSAIPRQRSAARLHYEWMDVDTTFLLREYLSGAPRDIAFDSSYVLQCFVFGDGSGNQFRFCLDDGRPGAAEFHEVSQWITLDWYGWRLLEWDLSDSSSFGEWIGNGRWDNPATLYFDSFQLTHERGTSARVGDVYFDDLRVVQKDYIVTIAEAGPPLPHALTLAPNYPNPFNAVTTIPFYLPAHKRVELTIYDLLGRHVKTLLKGELPAGDHRVIWQGDTQAGSPAASGVYIYALRMEGRMLTRRMLLLK
ncbi:MAG: family 10 glycosylhydrolase [Candidatus Neomarinimicrobiota bacterium]